MLKLRIQNNNISNCIVPPEEHKNIKSETQFCANESKKHDKVGKH